MLRTFSVGEWFWHIFWIVIALSAPQQLDSGFILTIIIFCVEYFKLYKPLRNRYKLICDEKKREAIREQAEHERSLKLTKFINEINDSKLMKESCKALDAWRVPKTCKITG